MGTQFWNRVSRFETWQNYPDEQQKLLDWLREQHIAGVVFCPATGTFRNCCACRARAPILCTSSPRHRLTARASCPIPTSRSAATPTSCPTRSVTQRSFGMLQAGRAKGNRTLAFESYDAGGALLWRKVVTAAELR